MPEPDATNPAADWIPARLIPTAGIKGQVEQEARATSALLAVLTAVPDFSHRVLSPMGAPGGRLTTYTEVRLKGPDGTTHIPDGAVVIERGSRRWSCLVEVKTATATLDTDQVHRYLDMARQHGFDGVLTISSQIVADVDALPFKVNGVKVGKLTVRHLSWWQILTEAVIQHRFRGVDDPDQAWILNELIRYLTDERSGASGFEGMGPHWVRLRDAARNGSLRAADPEVALIGARWEQLVEYLCLTLSQELGVAVKRMRPRGKSSRQRLEESVSLLASHGVLRSSFRVPNAVGPIHLEADLGARKVTTSVDLEAPPDRKQARARISWLLRQLKEAPDDLRIDVRFPRRREGRSELLRDVREAPDALLLPDDPRLQPQSFTLARVGKDGCQEWSRQRNFRRRDLPASHGLLSRPGAGPSCAAAKGAAAGRGGDSGRGAGSAFAASAGNRECCSQGAGLELSHVRRALRRSGRLTRGLNQREKGDAIWRFQIYSDSAGKYRWRLKASNGQIVASSGESFDSKSNATRAAENVRDNAGSATIED